MIRHLTAITRFTKKGRLAGSNGAKIGMTTFILSKPDAVRVIVYSQTDQYYGKHSKITKTHCSAQDKMKGCKIKRILSRAAGDNVLESLSLE